MMDSKPIRTPKSEITNAEILNEFLEQTQDVFKKEVALKLTIEIFTELHKIQNDPSTRQISELEGQTNGPKAKAEFIHSKAEEILKTREDKSQINVELIEAVDPITNTKTHNVVVTIGDEQTGPTVDIMSHHDTVLAGDYSLSIEQVDNEKKLVGRTIQDDTIHTAALLASLKFISIPETGSIRLVFTDHEEDGCRGSSALLETLLDRTSSLYPYAVIALESTSPNTEKQVELAIGHRGKYAAMFEQAGNITDIKSEYNDLFRRLVYSQRTFFANTEHSELGKTSGTSTYGEIKKDSISARLDFRTNTVVNPDVLEAHFYEILEQKTPDVDDDALIEKVKNSFDKYEFKIQGKTIEIKSKESPNHPSAFTPENDLTVMPIIYLIVNALGETSNINSISWGDSAKANSNPNIGTISFEEELSISNSDELISMLKNFDSRTLPSEPDNIEGVQIKEGTVTKSYAVETNLEDGIISGVVEKFSQAIDHPVITRTVNFMTDAARIFNAMKRRNPDQKVCGMVIGVGNEALLHGIEKLTIQDCLMISKMMRTLPNIINQQLIEYERTMIE